MPESPLPFPLPLEQYVDPVGASVLQVLWSRMQEQPINAVATAIFFLAVLHTFVANRFRQAAHHAQHEHDAERRRLGLPAEPSFKAEMMHFLGEVEVVFGLWALALLAAVSLTRGWDTARIYLTQRVHFVEPMFVVVVMAIAATPSGGRVRTGRADAGGGPGRPDPGGLVADHPHPRSAARIASSPSRRAMTICAVLLGRQFYALEPSHRLRYATLGLLFVNVSIGGTLTHFAAPPVLMVSAPWDWSLTFMATQFGWKACAAIVTSNALYFGLFRHELRALEHDGCDYHRGRRRTGAADPVVDHHREPGVSRLRGDGGPLSPALHRRLPVLPRLRPGHFAVSVQHRPEAAAAGRLLPRRPGDPRSPARAGGLGPTLRSLAEDPLFWGATVLTAFNDNALITYLATLVPDLDPALKYAVVAGAVTGGGLTVIANAPNPAGQALLGRHFSDGISPLGLAVSALAPTLIAAAWFMLP